VKYINTGQFPFGNFHDHRQLFSLLKGSDGNRVMAWLLPAFSSFMLAANYALDLEGLGIKLGLSENK
jgi:hypothetical protein